MRWNYLYKLVFLPGSWFFLIDDISRLFAFVFMLYIEIRVIFIETTNLTNTCTRVCIWWNSCRGRNTYRVCQNCYFRKTSSRFQYLTNNQEMWNVRNFYYTRAVAFFPTNFTSRLFYIVYINVLIQYINFNKNKPHRQRQRFDGTNSALKPPKKKSAPKSSLESIKFYTPSTQPFTHKIPRPSCYQFDR